MLDIETDLKMAVGEQSGPGAAAVTSLETFLDILRESFDLTVFFLLVLAFSGSCIMVVCCCRFKAKRQRDQFAKYAAVYESYRSVQSLGYKRQTSSIAHKHLFAA